MATFTLNWTPNIIGNVTGQRVYRRQKSIGGSFLTTGFTPSNDLSTSANTATIGSMVNNVIYEFQVANLCTTGGPTFHDTIQEGIKFTCLGLSISPGTDPTTQINVESNTSGTDIQTITVNIIETISGNLIETKTLAATGSTTMTFSGLQSNMSYSFTYSYTATINGVSVSSFVCSGGTITV